MLLEARNLACGYDRHPLLRDVHLDIESGEFVCLLGPNGIGKTTLFKTLLGLLKPLEGVVRIDGVDIHALPLAHRAQRIAYVPQSTTMPFPYAAVDVVMMGRSPWIPFYGSPCDRDRSIADEAMRVLSIAHLKNRAFTSLSGGEKQLVIIARAVAQSAELLVLDEPTSNLDFGNQSRLLSHIQRLRTRGIAIIMTTHHPNQAFEAGGRVVLIDPTHRVRVGDARSVLTAANLKDVFGVDVAIATYQSECGNTSQYCIPVHESREAM